MKGKRFTTFDIASSALFAALTAVGALISIPIQPVPITLQTFFTYLSGTILGARRGAFSQTLYVLMGTAGLPIFAGGQGGPQVLLGPRGGYLLGFIAGSYAIGKLVEVKRTLSFKWLISSIAIGTVVIYSLGVAGLSLWLHFNSALSLQTALEKALLAGVIPFLLGDSIKIVAASFIGSRSFVIEAARRFSGPSYKP